MTKLSVDEFMALTFFEEIQKELNSQIVKKINDPMYVMESSPATYDSEETKEAHRLANIELSKTMKEYRRRLDEDGVDDDDFRKFNFKKFGETE